MKEIAALLATILYLYNAVYAFIYWGVVWGVVNLFLPIAVINDLVTRFGRF